MKIGLNTFWSTLFSVVICFVMLVAGSYAYQAKNWPIALVLAVYAFIKLVNIAMGSVRDSIKRKRLLVSLRKFHGYALSQSDWDLLNMLIMKNHH